MRRPKQWMSIALCLLGIAACAADDEAEIFTAAMALGSEGVPATREMYPAPPLSPDVDRTPLDVEAVLAAQAAAAPREEPPSDAERCTTDRLPPAAPSVAGPPPDPHARPVREPEPAPREVVAWDAVAPAHPEAQAELVSALAGLRARSGTVDADSLTREKIATAVAIETRWATAMYRVPDSEPADDPIAE